MLFPLCLQWLAVVALIPTGKPAEESWRKGRIGVKMLSISRLSMQLDQNGTNEDEWDAVMHGVDYRGFKIRITPVPKLEGHLYSLDESGELHGIPVKSVSESMKQAKARVDEICSNNESGGNK
jgi:hypothetical protein